jgi:hypothetical protein
MYIEQYYAADPSGECRHVDIGYSTMLPDGELSHDMPVYYEGVWFDDDSMQVPGDAQRTVHFGDVPQLVTKAFYKYLVANATQLRTQIEFLSDVTVDGKLIAKDELSSLNRCLLVKQTHR